MECGNLLPLSEAATCRGQNPQSTGGGDKSPLNKALTSQRTPKRSAIVRVRSASMQLIYLQGLPAFTFYTWKYSGTRD